jgi:hypothetical protein
MAQKKINSARKSVDPLFDIQSPLDFAKIYMKKAVRDLS